MLKKISDITESDFSEDSDDETKNTYGEKYEKMSTKVILRKRFPVHISYDKDDVPQLNIIPSEWRYPTFISGANSDSPQGDHVIAYNLILNSLSMLKGSNIQTLPGELYRAFVSILPEEEKEFRKLLKENNKNLHNLRIKRKQETSALRRGGFDPEDTKKRLKKLEIEEIVRYVEKVADEFVTKLNFQGTESFSSNRKENVKPIVKKAMEDKLDAEAAKYNQYFSFYQDLKNKINEIFLKENKKTLINTDIESISGAIKTEFDQRVRDKLAEIKTLAEKGEYKEEYGNLKFNKGKRVKFLSKQLLEVTANIRDKLIKELIPAGFRSVDNSNVNKGKIQEYISSITPLKKQSESDGFKLLESTNSSITQIIDGCFQLFDYPKVNDQEQDNLNTLFESLAKSMVLIFNSFHHIKNKSEEDKKEIFNGFIDKVLDLQLWNLHKIDDKSLDNKMVISKLEEVSVLDFKNNNFFMLSEKQKDSFKKIKLIRFLLKAHKADEGKAEEIINELNSSQDLKEILENNFQKTELKQVFNNELSNKTRVEQLDKLEDGLTLDFRENAVVKYLFNPCHDIFEKEITDLFATLNYDDKSKETMIAKTKEKMQNNRKKFNNYINNHIPATSVLSARVNPIGAILYIDESR